MKNFKIYILLLLVPFILIGCVEKGAPVSGISVDVSSNPYTFEQLQGMISDTDPKNESSRLDNNVTDINSLKKDSLIAGDTYKTTKITSLVDILNKKVYIPIMSSNSTFNYYTALSDVTKSYGELTSSLGIKSLSELEEIKDELDSWAINNPNDNTLVKIISNMDITINTIKSRTAINPFYAPPFNLYYEYLYNIGSSTTTTFLKTTYNIDINNLNKTPIIETALVTIKKEIADLKSNKQPIDPTEKLQILGFLEDIQGTYEGYLNKTVKFSDLSTLRTVLRSYETNVFAVGSASLTKSYETMITNVFNQLLVLQTSDDINKTSKKNEYINQINEYLNRNASYTAGDYSVITSKVVNVLEELEYLKGKEFDLFVFLELTKPW